MSRPTDAEITDRDHALNWLVGAVPYIRFLGIRFDREGDQITAHLPFQPMLIGNPMLPALHGGVTAAFLEVAAIIELGWSSLWEDLSAGRLGPEAVAAGHLPPLPKTIDFTVDYLRAGQARDCFARARVNRSGRLAPTVRSPPYPPPPTGARWHWTTPLAPQYGPRGHA